MRRTTAQLPKRTSPPGWAGAEVGGATCLMGGGRGLFIKVDVEVNAGVYETCILSNDQQGGGHSTVLHALSLLNKTLCCIEEDLKVKIDP